MRRTVILYSLTEAAAAFALQWLKYLYAVPTLTTEVYAVVLATAFLR